MGPAARRGAINKCLRWPGPPPSCRDQERSPQTPLPARTAWSRRSRPYPPRPDGPALAARSRCPPPLHLPRLPCWRPAGRLRRGAPRARLPEEGWRLPGVYSCPSAAAGLSRVLGRRSAPGSGSNCGPGVRQPSSRDRRAAAAAGDSSCGGVAGRQRRPSTERGPERRRPNSKRAGRSGGAACSAAETAPPRRACARPPPPPAWLAAARRGQG